MRVIKNINTKKQTKTKSKAGNALNPTEPSHIQTKNNQANFFSEFN